MARNWIKIETVTCDKPEVCVVATQLKVDPDMVVGKLVRLWSWAEVNRINGNEMNVTFEFIDKVVGKKGFAAALAKAGWLREIGDKLQFPNFGRHNGPTGKGRALTAQRVSRHRDRKRNADENVTINSAVDSIDSAPRQEGPIKPRNERKNTVKALIESAFDNESTLEKEIECASDIPVFEEASFPAAVESVPSGLVEASEALQVSDVGIEFNPLHQDETNVLSEETAESIDAVTNLGVTDEDATERSEKLLSDQSAVAEEVMEEAAVAVPLEVSVQSDEEEVGAPAQKGRKGRAGIATPRKVIVPETPDQPLLF